MKSIHGSTRQSTLVQGIQLHMAFALIDLLAVLAIVAVLGALLFPIFARVRERNRQSSCASNLRVLGVAFSQYEHDNDGVLPVSHAQSLTNDVADVNPSHYPNEANGVPCWPQALYPYANTRVPYYCPDDSNPVGVSNGLYPSSGTGIGFLLESIPVSRAA